MFGIAAVFLLGIFLIVWLWQSHFRAREIVILTVKKLCQESQVQWLDQSVTLSNFRIKRHENSRFAIYQTFIFDYAKDDGRRFQGQVSVCRGQVVECGLFAKGEQKAKANTSDFTSKADKPLSLDKKDQDNVVTIQQWIKNKKSHNDE